MITITETARQKIAQLGEQFTQPVKGLRVSAIPRSPIRASFTSPIYQRCGRNELVGPRELGLVVIFGQRY